MIEIEHDYRRSPMARGPEHRIGTTGRTSPVDAGRPKRRPALRRCGLDPDRDGRARAQSARLQPGGPRTGRRAPGPRDFDTFGDPTASAPARGVGAGAARRARSSWAQSRTRPRRSSAPRRSRRSRRSASAATCAGATASPTPSSASRARRPGRPSRRSAPAPWRSGWGSPTPVSASSWSSSRSSPRPRRAVTAAGV